MVTIRFKTLPPGGAPHGHQFVYRRWHQVSGPLVLCGNGFHCSANFVDAMSYVTPGTLAVVAVDGEHLVDTNKECWERIQVIRWATLTRRKSVDIALYCAADVLPIWERAFPDDDRPAIAIEAGRKWLKDPSAARDAAFSEAGAAAGAAAWAAAWGAAKARYHKYICKVTGWEEYA